VCQNTFTPWNADSGLTVRHTRNAKDIATSAIQSLEMMIKSFDKFDLEIQRLLDIPIRVGQFQREVIPAVIGSRPDDAGRAQTMYDTAFDSIVAEWNEKTRFESAFDAVMAVQGYEQHRSLVRNTTRDMAAIRRLMDDKFPLTNKAVSVFN